MQDMNLNRAGLEQDKGTDSTSLLFGIQDPDKLEAFEKKLSSCIFTTDLLKEAVEKMVSSALESEFGSAISKGKHYRNMLGTISCGILQDPELRRQALIVIDRFARSPELNA